MHFHNIDIVVNVYDEHMVRKRQMLSVDDISEILSTKVIGTIPLDRNVIICQNKGVPVCEIRTKSRPVFSMISKKLNLENSKKEAGVLC